MRTQAIRNIARWVTGLGLSLALLASTTFIALADTTTPTAIKNATPVGGTLAGSASGGLAYYTVDYPGNSTDLRVRVMFGGHDPIVDQGLGFNVYGPNAFQGAGDKQDDGSLELSYAQAASGQLLVQVYNYTPGANVPYSIAVKGLPSVPATATVTAVATTTPAAPANLAESKSGTVVGRSGGAFATFVVDSAAEVKDVIVKMTFAPDETTYVGALGFQIYDPSGNLVATGTGTDTVGVRQATFNLAKVGRYMVQVYNYAEGATMNYTLAVTR